MTSEDICKVCGLDITGNGVHEMFYSIPISSDWEIRVNICGDCLNNDEDRRMVETQRSGEGDDWYHFELHEKEVTDTNE